MPVATIICHIEASGKATIPHMHVLPLSQLTPYLGQDTPLNQTYFKHPAQKAGRGSGTYEACYKQN